jgi:GTP-binding protein
MKEVTKMFVDRVSISIKAGDGGNGAIAFRREKYVDKGGPSGGDGGRGGSIFFVAEPGMSTLYDFKFRRIIEAKSGEKGMTKNRFGASAEDIYIKVPVGTVVTRKDNGRLLADFRQANQIELIAKGGKGGRGNAKFASSTHQVPRIAENGELGEKIEIDLELKLLADVGLVGFPSVGKSTLLAAVSAAKPEIADYPFTTLIPNLGVVSVGDNRNFVMADLPGLIEGAHQGKGLGLQFLRHIERCRVLIHVVDMSSSDGRDPISDFTIINTELEQYGMRLLERPMIVAANKMDDEGAILLLDEFQKRFGENYKIFPISALTKKGIEDLDDINMYSYEQDRSPDFIITRLGQNTWKISGDKVESIYQRTNLSTDDGILYLLSILRKMGVEKSLSEMGVKQGDTVKLCDFEFDYYD